jgi:hypothetical protein
VLSGVGVVPASMSGQTNDTLVVIVRFQGTGVMSGYDLVTWRSGKAMGLKAHHPQGSKARVEVLPDGVIEFWAANFDDDAPNCCPNFWDHDKVRWNRTVGYFRIEQLPKIPTAEMP